MNVLILDRRAEDNEMSNKLVKFYLILCKFIFSHNHHVSRLSANSFKLITFKTTCKLIT